MATEPSPARKARQALLSAQVACLAFALSLLVWGLTPVIVQRLVARDPAVFQTLAANSLTLLLGLTFIGLYLLIRRGLLWALWATVLVSLGLLTGGMCVSLLEGGASVSMCALLLATTAGLTSAFAITTRKSLEESQLGSASAEEPFPPNSSRFRGPPLTPAQPEE